MKFSKTLLGILIFAFVIRLIGLNQSLWLDEAITTLAVKEHSLVSLITNFSPGDFHPPLHYVILWFWVRIFGAGEIAVRLPSVIFGCLAILVTYLIGKKLVDIKTGLITAALMAFAPLLIYYSQEARMYSLNVLVVTVSMYFFINLCLEQNRSKQNLIGLTLINISVLLTDYIIYLIFPAQLIYLMWQRREILRSYLISIGISFIFLVPWLPIFFAQLEVGQATSRALSQWSNIVGGANLKEIGLIIAKTIIGRISFENKYIYGLVVGLGSMIYGYLLLNNFQKHSKGTKILIFWLLVPVVLAALISFYIPVLSYFRMIFILPAFYLLAGRGLSLLPRNIFKVVMLFIIFINLFFIYYFNVNPRFHREDWKSAAASVDSMLDEKSIVLFENNTIPFVYKYYSTEIQKAQPGLVKIPATSGKNVIDIHALPGVNKIFAFEYLVDITDRDRLLERQILEAGFKRQETINFSGVGFVHIYEKQ